MYYTPKIETLKLLEAVEYGVNLEKGNLVGIQPYMEIPDYGSESAFFTKMDGYFAEAARKGWLNSQSIVVLPEYVASWLVVADQGSTVLRTKRIELAMAALIARNLPSFLKYLVFAHAQDRVKYAIFRMRAETVLRIYVSVFSRLSKKYGVTTVAGSAVLPEIKYLDGKWKIQDGPLFNSTIVFKPDGSSFPQVVHKIYPTPQELPFTRPGQRAALPVFETPAGRLGVLNCADSWYADTYAELKRQKVDFLAVPSFVEKDQDTHLPWRGNNITPAPPEFDPRDFYTITYDDAWLKYAMASRFPLAETKTGMNVFLRGRFWNMGSDGRSTLIKEGQLIRGADGNGAAIQNLWIN